MAILEETLNKYPTFIITKQSCPKSDAAIMTLNNNKIGYHRFDSETDDELVAEIKAATGITAMPIVYLNKKIVPKVSQLKQHIKEMNK